MKTELLSDDFLADRREETAREERQTQKATQNKCFGNDPKGA